MIESYLLLLTAGAFSIFFFWMGSLGGFYKSLPKEPSPSPFSLQEIVALFVAFIWVYIFLPPYVYRSFAFFFKKCSSGTLIGFTQFSVSVFLVLLFCIISGQKRKLVHQIWKDMTYPDRQSYLYDCGIGFLGWLLSIPSVAFVSQLFDIIVYHIWGRSGPDQMAVNSLKQAMGSFVHLTIALISIVILAPILEEYLFRGCLQSWMRKQFSFWKSNIICSIIFALMHFSTYQGISNIPLLASLFVLSLYLGYTYERQRSLFAPIVMHMTFNFISSIRIMMSENGV